MVIEEYSARSIPKKLPDAKKEMVSETIKVNLAADAEARPVAVLVQKASQYESRVYIQAGDKKINAKTARHSAKEKRRIIRIIITPDTVN